MPDKTRRYHLRHVTTYEYGNPAAIAHHDFCLKLRNLPTQRIHHSAIQVEPQPDTLAERVDTFGNWRHFLAIERNHDELRVVAEATIDVIPRTVPLALATPAWETVRAEVSGEGFPDALSALEFSLPSPGVKLVQEVTEYARKSFTPGRPILEAAIELNHRIYKDFQYEPGATAVSTPVAEAFAARHGVCQDFAQIAIAGLRGLGLGARYVSGYIRTTGTTQSRPDPSAQAAEEKQAQGEGQKQDQKPGKAAKPKAPIKTSLPIDEAALRGADASHAWFSIWCGSRLGWIDLDPTNDLLVNTDHVVIGWGRDYLDISPVKGVILGGGTQELSVAVDLIPDTALH
jgi:transglutaminase-like putative cysteine protease